MKAILELEVTMREQAENRAKNQDHDHSTKKRRMPKSEVVPERVQPPRKSVLQSTTEPVEPEPTKKENQAVKTSVIMSTPEFNQRHKLSTPEKPKTDQSPEIVKKERIRDPVIEIVDNKKVENGSQKTPTKKEDKPESSTKRPSEKIRMNSFLMDEAVTSLLDMAKRWETT